MSGEQPTSQPTAGNPVTALALDYGIHVAEATMHTERGDQEKAAEANRAALRAFGRLMNATLPANPGGDAGGPMAGGSR